MEEIWKIKEEEEEKVLVEKRSLKIGVTLWAIIMKKMRLFK